MTLDDFTKQPFSEINFRAFITEHLGLELAGDSLDTAITEDLSYKKIVESGELGDKSQIEVIVLKSQKGLGEGRVKYTKYLETILKNNALDVALMAIYNQNDTSIWKLSLVVASEEKIVTSSKRYIFELGDIPHATALEQLSKLTAKSGKKEYLEAFSVEKLNERFFADYKKLFEKLNGYLSENNFSNFERDHANIRAFSKKLLGRITFLYFLQKKGWLGVNECWGDGERDFLQSTFKKIDEKKNFYEEYLKAIFFEGLSTKRDEDKFALLNCKIPFLNGGLFEAKDFDHQFLMIDNSLFEKIFETFAQYNFTIIEDTPHESEVAIDPEMLGKVFEDLLEDRKEKGAFYTPREIVHYMCQTSLQNYMQTKPKEITELDHIKKIKILDPAIGSGAFPMGMLHEIVEKRIKLGDTLSLSKMKRDVIETSIYGVDIEPSAVEIAKLRFWLSIVVDEAIPTPLPNLFYKIMVGNSLLETINGFDPLEKDMTSLFSSDEILLDEIQLLLHQFYNVHNNEKKRALQNKIEDKIDEILNKKLEQHEEELKSQVNNASIFSFDKKKTKMVEALTANLALTKRVKKRPTTELFFYKLYFAEVINAGGFDVVIGNPPYVRHEKIKAIKERLKTEGYKSYNGTADLYIYFFEQGYKLLKENGILSYITSNKYTRAKYGKEFREFVLDNTNILEYIDFNGVKVFESATVDTSILSYKKSKVKKSSFIYCDVDTKYKKGTPLENFVTEKGFDYPQSDLSVESFSFANPQELAIKKKIEAVGIPLKDWNINYYRGITTGFNEAFVIDDKTKDELIYKDIKNSEVIKPLLRGRDIKRYSYEFADLWLINIHNNPPIDINEYPVIKEYLDNYYPQLEKRSDKGLTPYNLRNCAYYNEFEKEKIIFSKASKEQAFAYTQDIFYLQNTCYLMTGKNLKYLISILNSKLSNYIFRKFFECGGINGEITLQAIEQLPIPKITKEAQKPFEVLVDYIMLLKTLDEPINEYVPNSHIVNQFEEVLDAMVYELYFKEEFEAKEIQYEKEKGHIEFISYAKKDYPSIDNLDENEAIEVIQNSYKKVREPYNRIRNNLILIDIEFSEFIKPIKGDF